MATKAIFLTLFTFCVCLLCVDSINYDDALKNGKGRSHLIDFELWICRIGPWNLVGRNSTPYYRSNVLLPVSYPRSKLIPSEMSLLSKYDTGFELAGEWSRVLIATHRECPVSPRTTGHDYI